MQELYEKISELSDEKVIELSLSYLEIYNETIRDLLIDGAHPKGGLMLREDSHQAVSVAGLSSHHPKNVRDSWSFPGRHQAPNIVYRYRKSWI